MAKSLEKIRALNLRRKGESVKSIANILGVSKSSVSLWCRDIILSPEQIENLHVKMVSGGYKGRLKGALMQKEKREVKVKKFMENGGKTVGKLSSRDLLMVGLGLYLGEGSKGRKFQFTNSNPQIVRLAITWLNKILGVNKEDFLLRVFINESHKNRELIIRKFWSKLISTPAKKFQKTVFIKAKNKKIYENPNHYMGVLTIRIKKSTDLQYRINGLNYHILSQTA